jgi:beta-lactamase superfamily II metal-dependent hydrolase
MDEKKLNIRVYNVGVGDCIYVYIPHPTKSGKEPAFHILIDCGTVSGGGKNNILAAQKDLLKLLPQGESGKGRLDLLIISHPHTDHYSGFDPTLREDKHSDNLWYSRFEVRQLWLSALLDKNNPSAKKAREIGDFALEELMRLLEFESSEVGLTLQINPAFTAAVQKAKQDGDERQRIIKALIEQVGENNVHYLDTNAPEKLLKIFPGENNGAQFKVLSPSREIDKTYLGKSLVSAFNYFEGSRKANFQPLNVENLGALTIPISDFRNLYNSLACNALTLAMDAGSMYNITGLVLFLEWNGYRFLFPGDAEFTNPSATGKERGAWNVIWEEHNKSNGTLLRHVNFLKVGHHGSDNATPWTEHQGKQSVNAILDALVQDPDIVYDEQRPCYIVVSTERIKSYNRTIPYAPLMKELGRRAVNARHYDEFDGYYHARLLIDRKKNSWNKDYLQLFKDNSIDSTYLQPQRTDLYIQDPACQEKFVDEYGLECASNIEFSFPPG